MAPQKENIEITPYRPLCEAAQFPLGIERICATELTYDDFFHRFMKPNITVILTSVADHWECYRHWISPGTGGSDEIDINFLKQRIENVTVPVADCGEAIFVPSGWYHQVRNEEDTISVNHNWFNGCNITSIWLSLNEAFENVVREIEDCKDMPDFDEHCQVMLKASHGMNFEDFLDVLSYVCDKRASAYVNNGKLLQFQKYSLGRNHIRFDLEAIRNVLSLMTNSRDALDKLHLLIRIENYIELINNLLV
ncbi:2-oxoglutarate and iron-dependent oxygenase JMJD4 homolog [Toxorhynchites rutilus septentrionalis]|uniref:2-oxoglutarate and iron-dependent oxygenase JMJD4 homolog n=1 Tax=Toxorhynchites rutilus septentrionalis TaxID=329112 RepID=UPI0024784849|nr:2-oxoglutarate and iron-dependent oxygenase JMJD4 homolog [Toxorhynchites rutilus septentrionalis]